MKIGLNALHVDPSYRGGINSFTLGVFRGLSKINDSDEFIIFVHEKNKDFFHECASWPQFRILVITGVHSRIKKLIKRIALYSHSESFYEGINHLLYFRVARQMDEVSDVIYTPTTLLFPYSNQRPTVISMHDIQQIHYPEFFSAHEKLYRKITFDISVRKATVIQASSQFIAQDLMNHFRTLKKSKVTVIHEGVDLREFQNRQIHLETLRDKYQIPSQYIYYPAQLWKHKDHLTVLRAVKQLRDTRGLEISVVLTGEKYSASQEIFDFIHAQNLKSVYYLGKVPFIDLIALYQNALAVMTAVLYESSSLCMLEGATAGVPLIASATPPNIEMSQILKMNLFKPQSVEDLATLFEKIWLNPADFSSEVEHNLKAISHYEWTEVAKKFMILFSQWRPNAH